MMLERFVAWIGDQRRVGATVWSLRALVVASALAASLATDAAAGGASGPVATLVGLLAIVAAFAPDGHVGTVLVIAIGARWLATVDTVTTPWVVVVAIGLHANHGATALLALVPPSARVPRRLAVRWVARSAVVAVVTVVVWGVVLVAKTWDLAGSAPLTALAMAVVGGLAALAVAASGDTATGRDRR